MAQTISEDGEEVEDDQRHDRPVTSRTEEKGQEMDEMMRKDQRLSTCMIVDIVDINKFTVIMHDTVYMTEVYAKLQAMNCETST